MRTSLQMIHWTQWRGAFVLQFHESIHTRVKGDFSSSLGPGESKIQEESNGKKTQQNCEDPLEKVGRRRRPAVGFSLYAWLRDSRLEWTLIPVEQSGPAGLSNLVPTSSINCPRVGMPACLSLSWDGPEVLRTGSAAPPGFQDFRSFF